MGETLTIRLTVNGKAYDRPVEPRLLLSDFLRHDLHLTGTHVGCEHGVCGACTVLLDGEAVRSCLVFAVQADGAEISTVEGLATPSDGSGIPHPEDADLHPIQAAFRESHGLQCGFCTPGILMTLVPFLEENPDPDEEQIREALSGHLCRCTGYQNIVTAVRLAADRMAT
ncbi:MAG: (2Fe-2S)-binding protein [Gemmatimonadetes bacterium]|nr:(2Fe-2S)-binding protein [Gemmatimonadota bacterium]